MQTPAAQLCSGSRIHPACLGCLGSHQTQSFQHLAWSFWGPLLVWTIPDLDNLWPVNCDNLPRWTWDCHVRRKGWPRRQELNPFIDFIGCSTCETVNPMHPKRQLSIGSKWFKVRCSILISRIADWSPVCSLRHTIPEKIWVKCCSHSPWNLLGPAAPFPRSSRAACTNPLSVGIYRHGMLIYLRVFAEDCEIYIIIYSRFVGIHIDMVLIIVEKSHNQWANNRDTIIIPVEWTSINGDTMGI